MIFTPFDCTQAEARQATMPVVTKATRNVSDRWGNDVPRDVLRAFSVSRFGK